jgi:N-acetyl-anhydromuramyl-L-alanine amidase AmpD
MIDPLKNEIIWSPTKNFAKRLRKPSMVVIHHTADESVENVLQWFQNPKSERSAHYVIEKSGQVHQLVNLKDVAWHCRGENQKSFGIEVVALGRPMSFDQAEALEAIVFNLLSDYALPYTAVTAHRYTKGASTECPGELFDRYGDVFGWAKAKFSKLFPVRLV